MLFAICCGVLSADFCRSSFSFVSILCAVTCWSGDWQVRKSLTHVNSALNESHVSDSDALSVMEGSQSVLILPSSYSFDQVQTTYSKCVLLWELCNADCRTMLWVQIRCRQRTLNLSYCESYAMQNHAVSADQVQTTYTKCVLLWELCNAEPCCECSSCWTS